MGVRIVPWSSLTATPWKNGGGTAVDIAVSRPTDPVVDVDWRVNVATIARSGPFSDYPDIDRDFRVLDGGAVELVVEGSAPRLLVAGGPAYRFPGDRPVFARLLDDAEPCRAFNVLTRRGVTVSRVSEPVTGRPEVLRPNGGTLVGVVRSGSLIVGSGSSSERLGELDAFVTTDSVTVRSTDRARLLLVHLAGS